MISLTRNFLKKRGKEVTAYNSATKIPDLIKTRFEQSSLLFYLSFFEDLCKDIFQ